MTDRPIDAVIDHAAALQAQVDQLSKEMQAIALAAVLLAVGLMAVSFALWHRA